LRKSSLKPYGRFFFPNLRPLLHTTLVSACGEEFFAVVCFLITGAVSLIWTTLAPTTPRLLLQSLFPLALYGLLTFPPLHQPVSVFPIRVLVFALSAVSVPFFARQARIDRALFSSLSPSIRDAIKRTVPSFGRGILTSFPASPTSRRPPLGFFCSLFFSPDNTREVGALPLSFVSPGGTFP